MKIKSLIVFDEETGKEYAFTHRSIVAVEEYKAEKDPEVQGIGLTELSAPVALPKEVKVEKKLKAKKRK